MEGEFWVEDTGTAGRLAGVLAQAQADLVQFTSTLLDQGRWLGDGVRSPEHWLQVYTGVSSVQARGLVRVAERGVELAEVVTMMTQGRLTLDQAAVIAEHVPAWALGRVLPVAEATSVTQLRRAVSRYQFHRQPQPHEEPRPAPETLPASLSMYTTGGRFRLTFESDVAQGALVEQAIREAKDALFAGGNPEATLADGLVEVAHRSLSAIESESRAEHYTVMVHLNTDGQGWFERGGALPESLLDRFTCDGKLKPVWESDGAPVSVGTSQRGVPNRTRRLVLDRDRGCRYPGCPAIGFVEVHHIRHWKDGGPTDLDNLVSLCPHHHRAHHLGTFTLTGDPNQPGALIFTSRWGYRIERIIPDATPEPPQRREPIRDVLRGERLDLWSLDFGLIRPPTGPDQPGSGNPPPGHAPPQAPAA